MYNLFDHQRQDIEFIKNRKAVLNFSEAGTGKTLTTLAITQTRRQEGRTLVVCPKSIMEAAWAADIKKFTPELTYSLAYAEYRKQAFDALSDIVIINHDGVKAIEPQWLKGFTQLIIDESTAFKTHTAQRSKAIARLAPIFTYRIIQTGTPVTNTITDIWHQVFIADMGQRLGNSYYRFRNNTQKPHNIGPITIWIDKEGIEPIIYELIKDITIRRKLEDCISMPETNEYEIAYKLQKKHFEIYKKLEEEAIIQIENKTITALNAAIMANKLAQVASGAVYSTDHDYTLIDTGRYELTRDLILAREQTVTAFLWTHQKHELLKQLKGEKVAVIDGTIPHNDRNKFVEQFQQGEIKHLLVHPKAGAHGLTLTAGHAAIWASPTYSSEAFEQFNRRVYRTGQNKKTETILIQAEKTIDSKIYKILKSKIQKSITLMDLMKNERN